MSNLGVEEPWGLRNLKVCGPCEVFCFATRFRFRFRFSLDDVSFSSLASEGDGVLSVFRDLSIFKYSKTVTGFDSASGEL